MCQFAYIHLLLVLCSEVFLSPVSLTQRHEAQRIEVQYIVPVQVSGRSASHLQSLHSAHCAGHFHVVRLGAVLSCLYVAVGPSKIWWVDANKLFANLGGGATGPYLSPVHEVPLAKSHLVPTLAG